MKRLELAIDGAAHVADRDALAFVLSALMLAYIDRVMALAKGKKAAAE
ncbi:hypothetical protein [Mesorhizobium sp. WSM3860]|nr:hypothetical protein [Mesorhizobium sp. WSM3860]